MDSSFVSSVRIAALCNPPKALSPRGHRLLNMEGMDDSLALELAKKGILTMEDLAEQSIDELMDIENMDEERAGKLIMEARAPWFEE